MKNNKNRLSYQANLSRHSHDTSAGFFTSISTGMILPVYQDILQPGDSVYYKTNLFARLQDIVTAFRGEIDLHVDYFFVPMQMMYTLFGQVFAQTNDVISNHFDGISTMPSSFPLFSGGSFENSDFPRLDSRSFGGECRGKSEMRLLNAFGLNPYTVLGSGVAHNRDGYTKSEDDINDIYCHLPNFSPWLPLAYQAIYQKFYRNEEFEQFNISAYNIDTEYQNTTFNALQEHFQLRYCQRPADYFTVMRKSPIAVSINVSPAPTTEQFFPDEGGLTSQMNELKKINEFLGTPLSSGFQIAGGANGSDPESMSDAGSLRMQPYIGSSTPYYNAQNIRAVFALDKFLRIYGRAGKTYDDQILAHFGVKIPHDVKHDLTHLKSYHTVLQADPIYSTATTLPAQEAQAAGATGALLGQVGGQGQCSLSTDGEKFTAPVHGVFMACCYAVTKPRYYHTFDKLNLLTDRLKFPIPEFDTLGAQPLYGFEISPEYLQSGEISTRVGWQNRYQEFKKKYNRIGFGFIDPSLWNLSRSSNNNNTNIYSPWVLGRSPFDYQRTGGSEFVVNGRMMFEPANALDTVMAVSFDRNWYDSYFSNPWSMFSTDPIIIDFFADVKKVSWMSETGEPSL